jgi:hypothetical protein
MRNITIILLLIGSICSAQDLPTFPEWIDITDTIYFDYSAGINGDGTYLSPFNDIGSTGWAAWNGSTGIWDAGQSTFHNIDGYALAFKSGTTITETKIAIQDCNDVAIVSYDAGSRPVFNVSSTGQAIDVQCDDVFLYGLDITHSGTSGNVVEVMANGGWQPSPPYLGKVQMRNVTISGGANGFVFHGHDRVYLDVDTIHNTQIDGIYGTKCDSLIFDSIYIYDVNMRAYDYLLDPDGSGGDGIQITGLYDGGNDPNDKVKFVSITNSTIDHSSRPFKHCVFLNVIDSTSLVNNTFISNDSAVNVRTWFSTNVERNTFKGGDQMLQILSPSSTYVYSCNFIGGGRTVQDEDSNYIYALGSPTEAHNITISNVYRGFYSGNVNGEFRNVVLYNVTDPYDITSFNYDTLSMYHYNSSGASQTGVSENSNAPGFLDANNEDFSITDNSPLKYAGTNVGMSLDITGYSWNNPPSIGAFEYIPTRPTVIKYGVGSNVIKL